MNVTVVRGLPGACQVTHLDLESNTVEAQFIVDELRGSPGVYLGQISEETELSDGRLRSVIDVRSAEEFDRSTVGDYA